MERFKSILREPQLLIDAAETLLVMLVAFGVGLRGDQQSYVIAVIIALIGLLKGIFVKPFAVPLVTDFARALLVLAASLGVGLNPDQIAVAITFIGTVMTLIATLRTTPRYDETGRIAPSEVVRGEVLAARRAAN